MTFPIDSIRARFPALSRREQGCPVAYFDGPAGSQTPLSVAEAMSRYLLETNSNRGGLFSVARESDAVVDGAHQAAADFLGTTDPGTCVFGANMTTLTFALSRALARTWQPGDEIIVTRLDHDANVTPWVLAARDAGATVKHIDVDVATGTLRAEQLDGLLSERTKLVAIGYASNVTGAVNPLSQMIAAAHQVGAQVFIDAVHAAPHLRINVTALDCDFLACSAYKFFGPHVGLLYGKRRWLEALTPYKLRVCTNELPGKWMTGTAAHESLAGVTAAVEYLATVGRLAGAAEAATRPEALDAAYLAIQDHEKSLAARFLAGLEQLTDFRLWGPATTAKRVATFSLTHATLSPRMLAERLAERGLFTWCGNHYGLPFTEAAGLEPHGTLRIGFLHYNTLDEVDRVLSALETACGS